MLYKEARGLSWLLIEETRPYFSEPSFKAMSLKEKISLSLDLLRPIGMIFEVRNRADRRIAKMTDMTDELAKRKQQNDNKAQLEYQQIQLQLDKELRVASG